MTDPLSPEAAQANREKAREASVAAAKNYLIFTDNDRGRAVLAQLKGHLFSFVNGATSPTEVMFYLGQRDIVLRLIQQIKIAGGSGAPDAGDPFAT